jgi:hypothetical protein
LSALGGLSGIVPFNGPGTSLTYGWPLLVLVVVLVLWRAPTARPPARTISLAATFTAFVAAVSIVERELSGDVLSSRYIYVYCLLAALLMAEVGRGFRPSRPVQAALCAVTLAAVVSNIGNLRGQGAYFRQAGAQTNGALTGFDLDRGSVKGSTLARISLFPAAKLTAHDYFAAERTLGTPAYTLVQLRQLGGTAGSAADSQLLADGDVTLTPAADPLGRARTIRSAGRPPSLVSSADLTAARAGSCLVFTPPAALAPGSVASATLNARPGRLWVKAGAAPATVSARRFAPTPTSLGSVAARGSAIVTVRRDAAPNPWYLELSSIAPVRACTLGR